MFTYDESTTQGVSVANILVIWVQVGDDYNFNWMFSMPLEYLLC